MNSKNSINKLAILASLLMCSNVAFAVVVEEVNQKANSNSEKITSAQAGAKAISEDLNAEIAARIAADTALQNNINTISLTPGPQGEQGIQGLTGDAGSNGDDGAQGAAGTDGNDGIAGADGTSCAVAQGSGSATITCGDVSNVTMASVYDGADGSSVTGNTQGDMQYWDGAAWVVIAAPAGVITGSTGLNFCQGVPTWGLCTFAIGDTGPAGGIVFYIDGTGLHGLEAASNDVGPVIWGCEGNAISGAETIAIGTGEYNTHDIVTSCVLSFTDLSGRIHYRNGAANSADSYTLNGYEDWFLPSILELRQLYFHREDVGGSLLEGGGYWSSSENDIVKAWAFSFTVGSEYIADRSLPKMVRPVRAF